MATIHIEVPRPVPRSVINTGADEAEEILAEQKQVVGYESFEQADAIRKELSRRGISTKVMTEVGPPIPEPKNQIERRVYRDLGVRAGNRYARFGLVRVRAHQRRK